MTTNDSRIRGIESQDGRFSIHGALLAALLLVVFDWPAVGRSQNDSQQSMHFADRVVVGGCSGWDFVTLDTSGRIFYVPCGTHVVGFDIDRGASTQAVRGLSSAFAAAIAPELHRGFLNDGDHLSVFDLRTRAVIARVARVRGDAIAYDSYTRRVFSLDDTTSVVDAVGDRKLGRIALGGGPESGASDGHGHVFVNLPVVDTIVVIDAKSLHIAGRWGVAPACRGPTSIAADESAPRLLVGCAKNGVLALVDAVSGAVLDTVRLAGEGVDQLGFDQAQHIAYSPSCHGNAVTVVRELPGGKLQVVGVARAGEVIFCKVAVDERTHRAYFATVRPKDPSDLNKGGAAESFAVMYLTAPLK